MMISDAPLGRFPWLGDACQAHYPGDYPAVMPYRVALESGSVRALYACWCGQRWTCWWDPGATGFPTRSVEYR